MNVHIEHDRPTDLVYIFITQQGKFLVPPHEWIPYDPGTKPKHYHVFDAYVWESIMKEAIGPTPAHEVLADTRNVRDRLLTMIETEWQSRQLEKS